MRVTKTINPLHFEDLEPHRFEDLVRQLIYDFREWQSLEATGRSGSDDGFDVRGLEGNMVLEESSQEDEENLTSNVEQRIWLIQCKRCKKIGPKDIERYIDEIRADEKIHGVIFAVACDFSKKARDVFFAKLREKGMSEGFLWGKAELEDMLFQPKNDYLLFAYFGVSLTIKNRSAKSSLNSILTIKRKLIRLFGDLQSPQRKTVLLRDVNDHRYPYIDEVKDFENNPPWLMRIFTDYYYEGIVILDREFYAYTNNDKEEWDYYEKFMSRGGFNRDDPWENRNKKQDREKSNLIHDYWYYRIPEANRAWVRVYEFIPFNRIIVIDEMGDEYTNGYGQVCPHLYVNFHPKNGPYDGRTIAWVEPCGGRFAAPQHYEPKKEKRIKHFPVIIPEISQEEKDKMLERTKGQ
jgi:hypothetical protein